MTTDNKTAADAPYVLSPPITRHGGLFKESHLVFDRLSHTPPTDSR